MSRRNRRERERIVSFAEREAERAMRAIWNVERRVFVTTASDAELDDFVRRQLIDLQRAEEWIKAERGDVYTTHLAGGSVASDERQA